jgi:hypothetical protein
MVVGDELIYSARESGLAQYRYSTCLHSGARSGAGD